MLLMGFLIAAFVKVAREAGQTERAHVAIAGIGIVVSYLVFCATSSFFAAQSATTFFVFFVGLLLGICYRSDRAGRA
jgi:mannose/fructose/N-acetylgalactosamine-specific phosphotransferase system component IIC